MFDDVEDILIEIVPNSTLNEKTPILEKLVQLLKRSMNKLMERDKKKFEHQVLEIIGRKIVI